MKGVTLFTILFLLSTALAITGEVITGGASSQPQNVSIFVLPGSPVITIYSPQITTYNSVDILLNYSIGGNFSQAWYNLDNNPNISLSNLTEDSFIFTTSFGSHTLYVFANNTFGLSVSSVSFTVAENLPPIGNDGGGGGGALPSSLQIDKNLIEASIFQGEDKQDSVKVTNTGLKELDLKVEVVDLGGFLLLDDETFSLLPGETRSIPLFFYSLSTTPEGIYVGRIKIISGIETKFVNVVLEINELNALFDMQLEIPRNSKTVSPGESVSSKINLINLGYTGSPIDVDLALSIKDFDRGKTYTISRETIAIIDELSLVRKLKTPENIPEGTYVFLGEVFYGNLTASSYETFEVKGDRFNIYPWLFALLIVIVLIVYFSIQLKRKITRDTTPYNNPFRKKKKRR